jgi:HAD superfamily hydrolase (TIGR01509 family)
MADRVRSRLLPPGTLPDRPGLVIFDCDGVLVDSEPLAAQVNAELLGELGWPISRAEVGERFVGCSYAHFLLEVEAHLGHSVPSDWPSRFRERFEALAEAELCPVEGVTEVLSVLAAYGVPRCVASNSRPQRVAWSLDRTGLSDYFDGNIFSASDVAHPKPAPDVFLLAAATMGVKATDAVVVEDSAFGVQAARRAGMAVYGYAGGLSKPDSLIGVGTTVFGRMAELPALFGLVPGAA